MQQTVVRYNTKRPLMQLTSDISKQIRRLHISRVAVFQNLLRSNFQYITQIYIELFTVALRNKLHHVFLSVTP